jgi:hypothetical protein
MSVLYRQIYPLSNCKLEERVVMAPTKNSKKMSGSDSDDSLLEFDIFSGSKATKESGKRERKQTKRLVDETSVENEFDEFDLTRLAAEVLKHCLHHPTFI